MQAAIIWGASGGIGRALVQRLNSEDWTTVAVSRRPSDLDRPATYNIPADVSNPEAVQHAVEKAQAEVEVVDLWIYAVGDIVSQKVAVLKLADWRRILDANLI